MVLPAKLARAALIAGAAVAALLIAGPAQAATRTEARPVETHAIAVQATCQQQSFLEGVQYSAVQIAQLARNAGFTGNDWTVSVAVAEAESAGYSHARLINTDCSVDRGIWQINSYWHGEVSDSCAFDPTCVAQATHTIWANGGWSQWTTYINGAYLAHMAEAQAAVNQVGGGGGGGSCSYPNWVAGQWYGTGSIVRYTNGGYYIATHDNPGYDPTISTWYWSPYSCG